MKKRETILGAMFIFFFVFILLCGESSAQNRVEKEVCSSGVGMNWKTSEEAKAYLLTSAKREAVGQIFGEFIRSVTKVENYQLSKDDIEAYSVGFIRVEGIPEFYNGKGLGEMCVRMRAYVTDGDLARFKAREVKKKVCVADPRLSLGEVRQIAEKQARVQAVKDFEAKLERVEDEIILKLIHESKTLDGGFVPDTTTYCTTASGVVYPIELTMVNESKKGVLEKVRSEPISTKEPSQTLIQKTSYTDSICGMEFVLVNGRKFQMGDVFGDGQPHEKPVHDVLVSSFYMGRYEVKIREFKKFVGATGYKTEAEKGGGIYGYTGSKWELQAGKNWRDIGFPQTDDHPVVGVSYNDVMEYIRWLNMQSGKRYRLPTEAEWEYAARSGGNQEKWAGTNNESEVAEYAWYSNNSGREIHPVGQKKANGLGLYDMTGNVWEWIQDWFDEHYYKSSPEKNPTGPNSGEYRVIRGGSWGNIPKNIRASHRTRVVPQERSNSIGFRMVLSLQ